jgi:hypothetical protein
LPEFCHQRTTLPHRDALEEHPEADDVRQAVDTSLAEG